MAQVTRADHPLTVAQLAELAKAELRQPQFAERVIRDIAPLAQAGAADLCFLDKADSPQELAETRAGACFVADRFAACVPAGVAVLVSEDAYASFALAARALFQTSLRPRSLFDTDARPAGAILHRSARLEPNVTVDPLALIGPNAEIGSGTLIAAGAVIGPGVCIGRFCAVGAGVTVQHALIGDRVTVRSGARIGLEGSGIQRPAGDRPRIPQTRRVIIQDEVEIGANAVIDRGVLRDTLVGEGTRIGNLVEIAHDAWIGRHCVIGGRSGIPQGTTLADFTVRKSDTADRDRP